MLSIRRKGKTGYIYYRGTVRVADKIVKVSEQSTGTSSITRAREIVRKVEEDIKNSILYPSLGKLNKITVDDCADKYLTFNRPKTKEKLLIDFILKEFEATSISNLNEHWEKFCLKNNTLSAASLNRYNDCLMYLVKAGEKDFDFKAPELRRFKVNNKKVFHLADDVRQNLFKCYSDHARPIFLILSYQGYRVQELLQLQWEDVNFKKHTVFIKKSKNGESRITYMHNKVFWILARMWIRQNKPSTGHVILNVKGEPYPDTRITGGSNPIRSPHKTALKKLKKDYGLTLKSGKKEMTIHDHRHDWASRMVMAGVDLITLKELGGWKSLKMVERYATFSEEFKKIAMNKIK